MHDDEKYAISSSDSDDASNDDIDIAIEELLVKADSCKISGNDAFKSGKNPEARKFYTKGITMIGKQKADDIPLEDIKNKYVEMSVSLHLNKAAVENRMENWKSAIADASTAITTIEKYSTIINNDKSLKVKAYFRRGIAHSKHGNLDEAKEDLLVVLKIDRNNKEALREYSRVKKQLDEANKAQRASFANAFGKSSGMYQDLEDEKRRAALRRIEAERARRDEWKAAVGDNLDEISFEDWCAKEDERAEQEKRQAEEEAAQRAKEKHEERMRLKKAQSKDQEDEVELDEEELKILEETKKKGYCYFRSHHSDQDREFLGTQTPTKLTTSESGDVDASETAGSGISSAWNANGTTWEEKDITKQAQDLFRATFEGWSFEREVLPGSKFTFTSKVKSIDGHAQIVVTRKKGAPVFDLSTTLSWEFVDNEKRRGYGTIKYPDIHNGVEVDSLERSISTKKSLSDPQLHEAALRIFETELSQKLRLYIDSLAM